MLLSAWLAFFSASIVLSIAPGPDNIFVLLQSATYGVRSGLCVIAGLCTGLVVQTLCAALGVAAVVAASPLLFGGICAAGALYLLWLAWGAWTAPVTGEISARTARLSDSAAWKRGTIMNITNPKVQIFFLAFFPQFLCRGEGVWPVWAQMTLMGATFIVATVVVFSAVAVCAGLLAERLRDARLRLVMNRVTALIFVALAVSALLQMASGPS